jgi:NAD(P)-dependent dehydrogenase (short-subunit alcohol dehydrogenase family)
MAGEGTGKVALISCGASSISAAMPMERLGKPEEIAYGCFISAPTRRLIVAGTELAIDGGRLAQ